MDDFIFLSSQFTCVLFFPLTMKFHFICVPHGTPQKKKIKKKSQLTQ